MSPANQQLRLPMDVGVRGLNALGNLSNINPESRNMNVPLPNHYLHNTMTRPSAIRPAAPPLPPRRNATFAPGYNRMSPMNNLSPMGSMYNPYSRFSPGMYSPSYGGGGYGGYRMSPYGGFGAPTDGYNSFIQMAEESTRPAFESIESVVEVVSSISMMLESTYHAVYSSYSAILGVVDQFSRLKDHLAQILSILALLRGLRWLCLKALYLIGLRRDNPTVEAAWNSAEQMANGSQSSGFPEEARTSAWPFLMFVGLVIGAPWLMFKLLSKTVTKKPFDSTMFLDESGRAYIATAAFEFTATQSSEMSFKAGEKLYIAPKSTVNNKGWVFACNENRETGFIPNNYLAVKPIQNSRSVPPPAPEWMANHLPPQQNNSGVHIAIPVQPAPLPNPNESANVFQNPVNSLAGKGAIETAADLTVKKSESQLAEKGAADLTLKKTADNNTNIN